MWHWCMCMGLLDWRVHTGGRGGISRRPAGILPLPPHQEEQHGFRRPAVADFSLNAWVVAFEIGDASCSCAALPGTHDPPATSHHPSASGSQRRVRTDGAETSQVQYRPPYRTLRQREIQVLLEVSVPCLGSSPGSLHMVQGSRYDHLQNHATSSHRVGFEPGCRLAVAWRVGHGGWAAS